MPLFGLRVLVGCGVFSLALLACDGLSGGSNDNDNPGVKKDYSRLFTANEDFDEGTLVGLNHYKSGELRFNADVFQFETPYLWVPLFTLNQVARVNTATGDVLTLNLKWTNPQGVEETCDNP
jgi:hypothetical protein